MSKTNAMIYRSVFFTTLVLTTTSLFMSTAPIFGQISTGDNNSSKNNANVTSSISNLERSILSLSNNTTSAATTTTSSQSNNSATTNTAGYNSILQLIMSNHVGPMLIGHNQVTNTSKVDQNTTKLTFRGIATVMLPPGNNITTIDSGGVVIYNLHGFSKADGFLYIQSIDGRENASVRYVEFKPDSATVGSGAAYFRTNSTAHLASLNNTVAMFTDEIGQQTKNTMTFWKWN